MSSDPRDRASEAAARVASDIIMPHAPDQRVGAARIATGDPSQVETLAEAIAAHCAALPRRYGVVDRMTIYDGDNPIAEFEGGGGSALDVARFLVMRATMEGKRLAYHVAATPQGSEREVAKWRFFARPDAAGSPAPYLSDASSWNAIDALKLQSIHNHQLVQELITQSRTHAGQVSEMLRAQTEALKAIGDASTKILRQLTDHAERMGARTADAEDRAAAAQRDTAAHAAMNAEALALADEAAREAERLRREAEDDPTRKVVSAAAQGITEGLRIRIGGKPAEVAAAEAGAAAAVNGNQVNGDA